MQNVSFHWMNYNDDCDYDYDLKELVLLIRVIEK